MEIDLHRVVTGRHHTDDRERRHLVFDLQKITTLVLFTSRYRN